jgi:putative transcriptional regulator
VGHHGVVERLSGRLLIAGPDLWDPNFRRAIVLVGHHDDEGAVGVVLNRALPVTVHEAVPPLAELVDPEELLFVGGPVQPEAAVVVADFEDPSRAEVVAFDTVGFLPLETERDALGPIRRARVFAGYTGWGPGQLEAELERDGSWIAVPATVADVFSPDPGTLWDTVLRRLGSAYDMLRLMPADPSLN